MYQQLTNTLGRRFFRGPQILKKRPPKGSWLPQAKKVARVISNSHIGKLLLWRAPILAKRLPKGPWLPQAKKSPVLSTNHILGSRILKGPNSRKKASKRHPGRPREARPRKAQRGPERPREVQRGRAWIEQACKSLQKAPGRPKPKSVQFYQQLTYLGSRSFEGPQFPRKGLEKDPWSPEAQKCPVLAATHIVGSRFFEGPNSRNHSVDIVAY